MPLWKRLFSLPLLEAVVWKVTVCILLAITIQAGHAGESRTLAASCEVVMLGFLNFFKELFSKMQESSHF